MGMIPVRDRVSTVLVLTSQFKYLTALIGTSKLEAGWLAGTASPAHFPVISPFYLMRRMLNNRTIYQKERKKERGDFEISSFCPCVCHVIVGDPRMFESPLDWFCICWIYRITGYCRSVESRRWKRNYIQ